MAAGTFGNTSRRRQVDRWMQTYGEPTASASTYSRRRVRRSRRQRYDDDRQYRRYVNNRYTPHQRYRWKKGVYPFGKIGVFAGFRTPSSYERLFGFRSD